MSYPRDLDEYTARELGAELERRASHALAGKCDYCGQGPEAPPCRMRERHRLRAIWCGYPGLRQDEAQALAEHAARQCCQRAEDTAEVRSLAEAGALLTAAARECLDRIEPGRWSVTVSFTGDRTARIQTMERIRE